MGIYRLLSQGWKVLSDGTLDGNNNDVTNVGALDTETANITKQTALRAELTTDQSLTAGNFLVVPFDDIDDNLGEWDSNNNAFVPDESGEYWVSISAFFSSPTSGDTLQIEFDNGDLRAEASTAGSRHSVSASKKLNLSSGSQYKLEVRNLDNDDTLAGVGTMTYLTIWRVPE